MAEFQVSQDSVVALFACMESQFRDWSEWSMDDEKQVEEKDQEAMTE